MNKKLDDLCQIEIKDYFQCPLTENCLPIQDDLTDLRKQCQNDNILLPIFTINDRFFGTDGLSTFPLNIKNFEQENDLFHKKHKNDTFSFFI